MAERRKDPEYRAAFRSYMKDYAKKNRVRLNELSREGYARRRVAIQLQRKGLDSSLAVWIEQHQGRCDVCGGPPDGRWKRLNIDHDHKTGLFRGLLCKRCNQAIGLFRDNPELMIEAAAYLRRAPVQEILQQTEQTE
jgi:hypothetical protein